MQTLCLNEDGSQDMGASRTSQVVNVSILLAALLLFVGCDRYRSPQPTPDASSIDDPEHEHAPGSMGGMLTSLGRDDYHIELLIDADGQANLFCYEADETRLLAIPAQSLTGYISTPDQTRSTAVLFRPAPLDSDPPDMTSRFVTELPQSLQDRTISLIVPGVAIDNERYTARFQLEAATQPSMPTGVASDEAAELYLTPAGRYTAADIEANGSVTAREKYRGFIAKHDPNPKSGDRVCPITQTKANPECSWVIGGQSYTFCCPPCIDEFLLLAKTSSTDIRDADEYRKP